MKKNGGKCDVVSESSIACDPSPHTQHPSGYTSRGGRPAQCVEGDALGHHLCYGGRVLCRQARGGAGAGGCSVDLDPGRSPGRHAPLELQVHACGGTCEKRAP